MSGEMYYCPKSLDPDVPENWEKLEGVEPTGYSVGPVSTDGDWSNTKVKPVSFGGLRRTVYVGGRGHGKVVMQNAVLEAQRRRAGELMADWADEHLDVKLLPWQKNVLANMRWPYTPADELRDRLNSRIRGTDPGLPINWKGLQ